ncbi:unnamed protein product [Musa textilis]
MLIMSYEVLNFLLYMAFLNEAWLHQCYKEQNQCYKELLELGDKIGHVSTRLKEEEIIGSLRKVKHSFFDALKRHFATEIDGICSICQEEYEANDEIGELNCGHSYHVFCIKQWLL